MTSSLCKRLARQLGALADRALEPEELRLLEGHAAQCPRCGALLDRSRRIASMVADLPPRPAPEGILEGVWERLLEEEEPRLAPLLAKSLRPVSLGEEAAWEPDVPEASRLAGILAELPARKAPPAVDQAVFQALRRFLWGRSREARILRMVTTSLAAAASLLLCLGVWWGMPAETTAAPRKVAFVIQDEAAPPSLWLAPEAIQEQIHQGLFGQGLKGKEGRSKGR